LYHGGIAGAVGGARARRQVHNTEAERTRASCFKEMAKSGERDTGGPAEATGLTQAHPPMRVRGLSLLEATHVAQRGELGGRLLNLGVGHGLTEHDRAGFDDDAQDVALLRQKQVGAKPRRRSRRRRQFRALPLLLRPWSPHCCRAGRGAPVKQTYDQRGKGTVLQGLSAHISFGVPRSGNTGATTGKFRADDVM
jgi:hypothetical protein